MKKTIILSVFLLLSSLFSTSYAEEGLFERTSDLLSEKNTKYMVIRRNNYVMVTTFSGVSPEKTCNYLLKNNINVLKVTSYKSDTDLLTEKSKYCGKQK